MSDNEAFMAYMSKAEAGEEDDYWEFEIKKYKLKICKLYCFKKYFYRFIYI
jgi:hypothetical protein